MHRSAQLVLLLGVALAAIAYRVAFVAARRLAVERPRRHAPTVQQPGGETDRRVAGAA